MSQALSTFSLHHPPPFVWEINFVLFLFKANVCLSRALKINCLRFSLLTSSPQTAGLNILLTHIWIHFTLLGVFRDSPCLLGLAVPVWETRDCPSELFIGPFRSDRLKFKNALLFVAPPRAPSGHWKDRTSGCQGRAPSRGKERPVRCRLRGRAASPAGLRRRGFCAPGLVIH